MASGRARIENEPMTDERRALLERLGAIPGRLASAARVAASEPPAPGEWTPSDVVRHLIAVEEEVWQPRLAQLVAEDRPIWPWTEPDRWAGEPGATLDRLLVVHAAARGATMTALAALDDAGWDRTGTHATYGVLGVAGLMGRAVDHDEEHVRSFSPAT
jgi:hypothetical protein